MAPVGEQIYCFLFINIIFNQEKITLGGGLLISKSDGWHKAYQELSLRYGQSTLPFSAQMKSWGGECNL